MSPPTAVRAAVQWEPGSAFDVTTVDLAGPGAGEVRVQLHAAGVCATDLTLTTAVDPNPARRELPLPLGASAAAPPGDVTAREGVRTVLVP